jgi:hypothetical protein
MHDTGSKDAALGPKADHVRAPGLWRDLPRDRIVWQASRRGDFAGLKRLLQLFGGLFARLCRRDCLIYRVGRAFGDPPNGLSERPVSLVIERPRLCPFDRFEEA